MEKLPTMDKAALEQKLQKGEYVLFFSADWCPDCQFIKPVMPELEEMYPQFKFILVDRDDNMDLYQELFVMGIPSFIVYKEGVEVGRLVNKERKTKEQIVTFLNNIGTMTNNMEE